MSLLPRINTLQKSHLVFLMGVIFFLYSWAAGLAIQTIIVPKMFPKSSFGGGLVVLDSAGFDQVAKTKAAEIQEKGWSAWELRPRGVSPAGVASIFYALWTPKSYSMLPFNALIHALSGCLILWVLLDFFTWKPSIFGSSLFVFNPAAMEWVAQIHRDGMFILGNLMVLACLVQFGRTMRTSKPNNLSWLIIPAIAGTCLVWIARPFWVQVLSVSVLLGVLLIGGSFWRAPREKRRGAYYLAFSVFVVVVLSFQGWLVKYYTFGFADLPQEVEQPRTVEQAKGVAGSAAVSGAVAVRGSGAEDELLWHRSGWLPDEIENKFYQIASVRRLAILNGGNTVVDKSVKLNSVMAFVAYVPRAVQLGLLSPLPELWGGQGSTPAMTMARKIMGAVTAFFYICLAGLLFGIIRFRKDPGVWIIVIFSLVGIMIYAYSYPNVGTLLRYRYGFYMMLTAFGGATIVEIIQNKWQRKEFPAV